jgi:hypothetical protein
MIILATKYLKPNLNYNNMLNASRVKNFITLLDTIPIMFFTSHFSSSITISNK